MQTLAPSHVGLARREFSSACSVRIQFFFHLCGKQTKCTKKIRSAELTFDTLEQSWEHCASHSCHEPSAFRLRYCSSLENKNSVQQEQKPYAASVGNFPWAGLHGTTAGSFLAMVTWQAAIVGHEHHFLDKHTPQRGASPNFR